MFQSNSTVCCYRFIIYHLLKLTTVIHPTSVIVSPRFWVYNKVMDQRESHRSRKRSMKVNLMTRSQKENAKTFIKPQSHLRGRKGMLLENRPRKRIRLTSFQHHPFITTNSRPAKKNYRRRRELGITTMNKKKHLRILELHLPQNLERDNYNLVRMVSGQK